MDRMEPPPYAKPGRMLKLLRMDKGWRVEDVYDHILMEDGPAYAPPPERIRVAEAGRCRLCIRYEFGLAKAYGKAPSEIWGERTRKRPLTPEQREAKERAKARRQKVAA